MGIYQASARVLHGAVFVLLVPLGLVAWSNIVKIPFTALHWPGWGFGIALGGLCILSFILKRDDQWRLRVEAER